MKIGGVKKFSSFIIYMDPRGEKITWKTEKGTPHPPEGYKEIALRTGLQNNLSFHEGVIDRTLNAAK